jgi:hypothetical protein
MVRVRYIQYTYSVMPEGEKIGGAGSAPLFGIGLTDPPKIGGTALPGSGITSTLCKLAFNAKPDLLFSKLLDTFYWIFAKINSTS